MVGIPVMNLHEPAHEWKKLQMLITVTESHLFMRRLLSVSAQYKRIDLLFIKSVLHNTGNWMLA